MSIAESVRLQNAEIKLREQEAEILRMKVEIATFARTIEKFQEQVNGRNDGKRNSRGY